MDFDDFISTMNEQFGMSNDDWDKLKKSAVITFNYDDRGFISGKYKGVTVYRDKNFESVIIPGETWICTLELNSQTSANYFAKPLQKIDASFIFEMRKDQIEEIGETIWNRYRDSIEPTLEEKYKDAVNSKIDAAIDNVKEEYESTIHDLSVKIQELEFTNAENDKIIESLQNELSCSESRESTNPVIGNEFGMPMNISVRRIGADSITSEFFGTSRYSIHISADHRTMIVVPNRSGDVICMDRVITLNGLSIVSPYVEPYDMISEYNPKYGGIQIFLK